MQRGLYATVPLEAEDPQHWSADAWAVAATALAPGYIRGWTALHHWDLTDQVFATIVFITSRHVPRRQRTIGAARLELRHRPEGAMFGTRRVWREGCPVEVSDPERTLADCLDDPSLGGGLRHTAEALSTYNELVDARWGRLIEYGDRLGNRTVFKRLGYLAETLGLADTETIDACQARVSAGIGQLDPARPASGPMSSRWGLRHTPMPYSHTSICEATIEGLTPVGTATCWGNHGSSCLSSRPAASGLMGLLPLSGRKQHSRLTAFAYDGRPTAPQSASWSPERRAGRHESTPPDRGS